jgi:uncharacterized protein DUF5989
MKEFIKEYWLWIVVPIALVVALIAVLVFLSGGESASPFQYNIF